jgi:opacity protein-like surface antigen
MKKSLVTAAVAAASLVALSAFAGGGAVMPAQHNTFAYAEINTGFANKHLNQMNGINLAIYDYTRSRMDGFSNSRGNNVWTLGGDVGYQFMDNLAIELGGNWLQAARVTGPFVAGQANSTRNLNAWVAYLAGKISARVYDHLSFFAKAGLGYQRQSGGLFDTNSTNSDGYSIFFGTNHGAWVPVLAVGANFDVNQSIFAGIQYMHFVDHNRTKSDGSWAFAANFTSKDLVTASLGYKFQM